MKGKRLKWKEKEMERGEGAKKGKNEDGKKGREVGKK